MWDSAGGLYPNDPFYPPGRPGLTTEYKQMFERQAQELVFSTVHSAPIASNAAPRAQMDMHPHDSFSAAVVDTIDFEAWQKEGYELAVHKAYVADSAQSEPELVCSKTDKLTLSPQYVRDVQAAAQRQIALAGYRLASLLSQTLPETWVEPANWSLPHGALTKEDIAEELRKVLREMGSRAADGSPAPAPEEEAFHTIQVTSVEIFVIIAASVFGGVLLSMCFSWARHRFFGKNRYRKVIGVDGENSFAL